MEFGVVRIWVFCPRNKGYTWNQQPFFDLPNRTKSTITEFPQKAQTDPESNTSEPCNRQDDRSLLRGASLLGWCRTRDYPASFGERDALGLLRCGCSLKIIFRQRAQTLRRPLELPQFNLRNVRFFAKSDCIPEVILQLRLPL